MTAVGALPPGEHKVEIDLAKPIETQLDKKQIRELAAWLGVKTYWARVSIDEVALRAGAPRGYLEQDAKARLVDRLASDLAREAKFTQEETFFGLEMSLSLKLWKEPT